MTVAEYAEALRSSLEQQGYGPDAPTVEEAQQLAELAAEYPVGTVLERRLDLVQVRAWPQNTA
jgi:hypothetical protein